MKLPKLPNMKTIKSTAKSAMVTTKILGKKYAPFVLLGVGLVGYGYSVYAGVKSGKKLEATKAKYEAKDAAGEEYTRMEVVKDVAKDVAIPVAVATASTAAKNMRVTVYELKKFLMKLHSRKLMLLWKKRLLN